MAIKTKSQLQTDIDSYIVTGGAITATELNDILTDMVDSLEYIVREYTTVGRDALTPTQGDKIFNTTSKRVEIYSGTMWMPASEKEVVIIDASGNPNYSEALIGDTYIVTVAGKVGGASGKDVQVGDFVYAIASNAGGTEASVGSNWKVSVSANEGATFLAETDISSAQLLAATNIDFIAAPGAGKIFVPVAIVVAFIEGATSYTAGRISVKYNGATADIGGIGDITTGTDLFRVGVATADAYANTKIIISFPDAPAGGDGTANVKMWYKIVNL